MMSEPYQVEFAIGGAPNIKHGTMKGLLVSVRSQHDGKIRTYCGYYLNGYPLEFQDDECDSCPGGDDCHALGGDGCPMTGWFYDESNFEYEHCYYRITGEVVAWAPIPQFQPRQ